MLSSFDLDICVHNVTDESLTYFTNPYYFVGSLFLLHPHKSMISSIDYSKKLCIFFYQICNNCSHSKESVAIPFNVSDKFVNLFDKTLNCHRACFKFDLQYFRGSLYYLTIRGYFMASRFNIYSMTNILYFLYNLLDIYILYKIHVSCKL